MRLGRRLAYATATCAGATAAIAGAISCVSNSNAPAVTGVDGALPSEDAGLPPSDATSLPDTTVAIDASPAPIPDAEAADTAPQVDAADANPGCVPAVITGFTVPPYVHATGQNDFCNDTTDQTMAQLCLDASAYAACAAFPALGDDSGVSPSCSTCLVTSEDAGDEGGTYGPSIVGRSAIPNVAGCIELADPSDAGLACAVAVQAAWRCSEFSCKTNCPVSDDATRAAYAACLRAAAIGPCFTYAQAAGACLAIEGDAGGQASDWCLTGDSGVDQFTDIARFFCSS